MFKETVGKKIKELRIQKGISQEKLANECGLIDDTQRVQIYREVNSGYELTCSFLIAIGAL